jgi:NADH-quinone oxidoreductase subunit A
MGRDPRYRRDPMPKEYFPVLVCLAIAIILGGGLLALSWAAGRKTGGWVKLSTYESGAPLLDRSQKRISIAFFLIAIDFVLFDVETAFLFPWALVARDGGWPLLGAVGFFLFLLLVGYAYIWKKGGLDWGRRPRPLAGGDVG